MVRKTNQNGKANAKGASSSSDNAKKNEQEKKPVPAGSSDKGKVKAKESASFEGSSDKRKGKAKESASFEGSSDKGKEKAREPVSEKNKKESTDPWQVDQWTWATVEKACDILKNNGYCKELSKQQKRKFDMLEMVSNRTHLSDSEKLVLAREILKALPKEGHASPIDIADAQQHYVEEERQRVEVGAVLKKTQEELKPEQTKRLVLQGRRPTHSLSKEGSTVTRIIDNFKSKPNSQELSKAEKAIAAMKVGPNHYLTRIRQNREKMFFYGTSEGQRMHVQAAKWAESGADVSAEILESWVIREMEEGEKETWREVSNYWLAGSIETRLGMVGERAHGLGLKGGQAYFEARLKEEIDRRSKSDLYVNLGGEVSREEKGKEAKDQGKTERERKQEVAGEKALFLSNFREAQNILGKDWVDDVKRSEYQDKPGKKVGQASASGSSSGLVSESSSNKTPEQHYDDLICRRMCKWILHLAAYNKQPVIYALDTIDLGASVEAKLMEIPDNVSGTGQKLKIPVCTSELREIFRYIDKLTNVEFYEELIPVDKPWERRRDPSLQKSWAEYALHLTRKMLLLYPGDQLCLQQAEAMLAAWDQKDWAQVIECYTAIKPSELLTPVFPVTTHQLTNHNTRIEQMEKSVQSMSRETAEKYRNAAFKIQGCLTASIVRSLSGEPHPVSDLNPASASDAAGDPNLYGFFPASSENAPLVEAKKQQQKEAAVPGSPAKIMSRL